MFREFDAACGLHTGVWEPDGEARGTVLAVHGITSSHKAWEPLARQLPDVRLVAPDLRGRGGSRGLPGPYGMARHADDVAALLAELGVGTCVAVGHSMGAYVAVTLAHRHPARVERLVLVDGGLPLPTAPDVDPEESLQRTLGPAAERLSRTFGSREEYRTFWTAHPAFADWTPDIEAYVDYDLVTDGGALRPATSYEAMAADSRDLVTPGNDAVVALKNLAVPTVFLRAERGMLDDPGGLFPAAWASEQVQRFAGIELREVADVNHYTITLSDRGAAEVADAVRSALGSRV